ncbi:MAG TPA: 5-formyltetrahydrofolate cyclo-ligase [Oligoflexia bacterium]|nr:5-formyltetrahydrofolate cyclo-ligase [Oligoflexia bacterium]HMR25430.1 5-formyltetrahydrofolate cyclo-ligase [Oligoflexia bacterium]
MKIEENKEYYRKQSVKKIQMLSAKQKSDSAKMLCDLFFQTIDVSQKKIKAVACYASDDSELSVDSICEKLLSMGITVALPRIELNSMTFYSVKEINNLQRSSYGIRQPKKDTFNKVNEFDLMLIPGRVFDIFGNRIGRGAGYYDKFLEQNSCSNKVGIAFDFQVQKEALPIDVHDIVMNRVITEKAVYGTN